MSRTPLNTTGRGAAASVSASSGGYIRLWVKIPAEMLPDIQAGAQVHGVEMMASAPASHDGTVRITYAAEAEVTLEMFDLWLTKYLQTEPQWNERLWHRMFS